MSEDKPETLTFICRQCSRKYSVPELTADVRFRCRGCGKPYVIRANEDRSAPDGDGR